MLPVTVPFPLREPARNWAVEEKEKFPPFSTVWPPLWVNATKLRAPVFAWTAPELLNGMDTDVVPAPPILRNIPSFTINDVPEFCAKADPSPSRSNVADTLLLKTPELKAS